MVSPELIRRYPFFAGLSQDQVKTLAKLAQETSAEAGHHFFHEGDELKHFYLVVKGAVAITMELPEQGVEHKLAEQFLRELKTRDIVISTLGTGDIFGWSGLVAPHKATASAQAVDNCLVLAFDCQSLFDVFEEDCRFGYLMIQKAAQVVGGRLRDMRIESLALTAE